MKINTLQERDKIEQPLLVTNVTKGVSNSGAPYMSITLQDNTGQIEGKLWDVPANINEQLKAGFIVNVVADVIKYKNNLQLKLHSIEIPKGQKEFNLSDFIITSSISKEELSKDLDKYIDMIKDDVLKQLVKGIIDPVRSDFLVYPAAAKNHHEYIGGLATHTLEMCNLAELMVKQYTHLNLDLLLAGILVHDSAKIQEYVSPIVVEYSTEGKLLGHISMAQAKVFEVAKQLGLENTEQCMLLRHMVLSHHGQYEYGSPVKPLIVEAEVLNIIDNLSARVYMFDKNLQSVSEGEFTSRVFPLENRSIYKPKL